MGFGSHDHIPTVVIIGSWAFLRAKLPIAPFKNRPLASLSWPKQIRVFQVSQVRNLVEIFGDLWYNITKCISAEGKASQLANSSKQDFLDFLASHNIPINYDVHELENDLSTVKEFIQDENYL